MMVVDQVVMVVVVFVHTFYKVVDTLLVWVVVDKMSFECKIHYKNYLLLRMMMVVEEEVEMEEYFHFLEIFDD
jgi:hypothetical protein